ncbi:non-pathogenic pore-forming peptide-like [Arapaima gigas]
MGKDLRHFENEGKKQHHGICWVCKRIVNKVKKSHPQDSSEKQKEVKDKLYEACGKMPHKASCKKFTRAKTDILVEKPSTTDDPKTACVDVGACRTKSTVEDIVLEALRSTKIS